jgi:hypothetical protein
MLADMGRINTRRIFSIIFASSFAFGVFSGSRTKCSAASAGNAIRIVSPAAGEVVADWKTLVKGELNLPASTEVGVTINGSVALVHREKFARVLLLNFPTPTTDVSATVTDSLGTVLGTHSIPITAKIPDAELVLTFRPFPVLATAPQSVSFTMTSLKEVARVELDLDGDGTIDWQGATLEGQQFPLPEAGLYFPTIKVTDVDGNTHTENALVQVFDPKGLDALLQAKWKAMKDALRQGDIGRAVNYIVTKKRDAYRKVFESLTIPLSSIDQVLTDIKFVELAGIQVDYDMPYTENGVVISGLVQFSLDVDGIWRVFFF